MPNVFASDQKEKKRYSSARRGPGIYTVVKCGASGHNIRCAPSLYSAPVGMLSLGDNITVSEVKEFGSGECWVKLDKETAEKYSFGAGDGEVWSLAVTATDTHHLESEAEIQEQRWPELPIPGGFERSPNPYVSPFGMSNAENNVWAPGVPALPPQSQAGASIFSPSPDVSMSPRGLEATALPFSRRKSLPRPVRPSTPPRQSLPGVAIGASVGAGAMGAGAINKTPNPNSPTFARGRAGSIERKSFFPKVVQRRRAWKKTEWIIKSSSS